jgi:hypothetical protein
MGFSGEAQEFLMGFFLFFIRVGLVMDRALMRQ